MLKLAICPRIILFIILGPALIACGHQDYETEHVRDFRLYVETNDTDIQQAVDLLIQTYNDEMGFDVISVSSSPSEANSTISFLHGIRSKNNVLGYGHWTKVTIEEGREIFPTKKKLKRAIHYSMDLEFDFDNFKEKSQKIGDHTSGAWAHLYHLFSHEVGHGLQMDHEEIETSVMYMSIPENSRPFVDYPSYFTNARLAVTTDPALKESARSRSVTAR